MGQYHKNSFLSLCKLTEDQIISKFRELKSVNETALFFNCTDTVISKILKKNGVKTKWQIINDIINNNKDKIISKYESEIGIENIANQIQGCSSSGILSALKRWGVKIRGQNETKKKPHIDKKCKFCQSNFSVRPSRSDALFCDNDCRSNYEKEHGSSKRIERINLSCAFCNASFKLPPARKRKVNFCNQECRIQYLKSGAIPKTGKKTKIICDFCKKEQYIATHIFKRQNSKYCSRQCSSKAAIGRKMVETPAKIDKICKSCNRSYQVWNYRAESEFCSVRCSAKGSANRISQIHKKIANFLLENGFKIEEEADLIGGRKLVDIFVMSILAVEINGDYWHCNPKKYPANFIHPISKLSAQAIWGKDELKRQEIEKEGYEYLCLWENEINDNFDLTKKKILDKLNLAIKINIYEDKNQKIVTGSKNASPKPVCRRGV